VHGRGHRRRKGGLFGSVTTPAAFGRRDRRGGSHRRLFQIRSLCEPRQHLPQACAELLDIGMAVVGWPRLLLLDEPTSGISIEEKFDPPCRW